MESDMLQYLQPTPTVDSDNPAIIEFALKSCERSSDPTEQAIKLYYAVRDGIRYDPYALDLTVEGLRASTTLHSGRGWCVTKAILLAACCRVLAVPARLGFADVKNHLSTARMRETMKTDVFFWHGYTSIYLNGVWVKATPAFNIELCEKFRIRALDFDGRTDSLYHPFDLEGHRHMEYLKDRGYFADVPIDQLIMTFKKEYLADNFSNESDFEKDVEQETSGS
jgi:transglutaminase-like putative cysteine protease